MFDHGDPKRLVNFRPLLFAAVGLIIGIAAFEGVSSLSLSYPISLLPLIGLILILSASCVIALIKRKMAILILTLFILIGAARTAAAAPEAIVPGRYNVTGTVFEVSQTKPGQYTLSGVKIDGERFLGRLVLTVKNGSEPLKIGDGIETTAAVKLPTRRFEAYDERLTLLSNGVTAKAECESASVVSSGALPLMRCFSFARQRLEERIGEVFSENAPIVSGFLLGVKSGVDEADMESFRITGTAHLLTLSGFHVGLLTAMLFFLLPKRFPKLRFFAVGAFLLIYCAIASFSASIVRASVMCMCMLLSDVTERRRDTLSSLALSALIILIVSPYMLYSVGFRLSFAATLGIVLMTSAGMRVKRGRIVKYIRSAFMATLGATAATTLISAKYFGTFPTYGLLANLVAVPLFSAAITMSFPILVFGLVFPGAAAVLAYVPNRIIDGAMLILDGVGSLPYAKLDVFAPSDLSFLLMLALMFSVSAYILRPIGKRMKLVLPILLLFTASLIADIIRA